MEAHRSVTLRDICTVQIGYTVRRRIRRAQDGVLTVQLRDVPPNGRVDPAGLTRLQVEAVSERYLVGRGDVLFRSRSESNTATVLDDRFQEPALAMLPLFILRPNRDVVLAEFVAWAINQPRAQRHFDRFARGTNMRMIPRAVLTDLEGRLARAGCPTQGRCTGRPGATRAYPFHSCGRGTSPVVHPDSRRPRDRAGFVRSRVPLPL